ncbi:HD domain-containing protein [Actinomyces mediterranea]|uniref:HD domain-containing protein n=1 Tax=Actinomyces mediterranea TaxID=1871028 RepID=UPI0009702DF4|nr:hypothetical protein [Actinomyces mediterranea]
MGAQAPQWLFSSFTDSMQEIGATASAAQLDAEGRDLVARWSDPERRLHNTRHLINVLAHIDELAATAHDPDVLRIATWYHGASLNRCLSVKLAGADPVSSAGACIEITREHLTSLGVSEDVTNRVCELLSFLARHRAPRSDLDAQVLVDADLAMLAVSPQEYKKYRESLRNELSDVSDVDFTQARRLVVKKLLAFDSIYQSPLGETWESAARSNLEVELTRLDAALSASGAAPSDDEETVEDDPADSVSDEDVTATGTLIIKRRQLKKNVCADRENDELTSTGVLPVLAPLDEDAVPAKEEDSSSSLEMAIEALDLPSTPAK